MGSRIDRLIQLPEKFPKISAGAILPDGRTLVSGHTNGYVVRWTIGEPRPEIILRTSSEVNSIVATKDRGLLVGCNAGDLYFWPDSGLGKVEQLRAPTNTKYTRVFRVSQPLPSTALVSSTYGVLLALRRTENRWVEESLLGHSNSVFAIAHEGDRLLATGDYRGAILIWNVSGGKFELTHRLRVATYVSGLVFAGPQLLAALDVNGKAYLFEWQPSRNIWKQVFDTDTASGAGKSMVLAADGRSLLAGTTEEIIQIDPDSQEVRSAAVRNTLSLFPQSDHLLGLTPDGLVRVSLASLTPKLNLVQYRYLKVGLLGNTNYGKTTLCSAITTGNPGTQLSTFGRRTWQWIVKPDSPQRRIMLNDNGGQEQLVGSLLPLVADSDAVLFFFKQTEIGGFRTALELHRRLKPDLNPGAKSYLVETYVDQPVKAVTDEFATSELKREKLDGLFKVVPIDLEQVAAFKAEFLGTLDWASSRAAVQSDSAAGLTKTIEQFKSAGKTVSTVEEIRSSFELTTKINISAHHLKFLLRSMTDSGQLEYYPKVGDSVVMDDPEYNELRTDIPVFAGEHGGRVLVEEVGRRFPKNPKYVKMLDRFYLANGISIAFSEDKARIFPAFLEDRALAIPADFLPYIADPAPPVVLNFPDRDLDLSTLLTALSDLRLDCVDVTKTEGLFSWGTRALVYYQMLETQSALAGRRLQLSYKVAGKDPEVAKGLAVGFAKLLGALYGKPEDNGGAKG
jgi:hypothetical protein